MATARGARVTAIDDPEAELAPLREIVDLAAGGAVIRAVLPLSAQVAFADGAARADRGARLVADAASGIVHVHLREASGTVAAADALLANTRALGGSARVERGGPDLESFSGPEPSGAFLMRRLKAAFDPAGILEPARSVLG